MNEIIMIPVEQLDHHPENPRKDLGDLTELTDSIKKNGIMQNLTVVAGHMMTKEEYVQAARAEGATKETAESAYKQMSVEERWASGGFTVVIGNRRMEAAKLAGLEELPCVISGMDHKTQIATMLEENMQRQDLTVYEQAQGFQMMMDLGYSAAEIAEKTGFGETTVRRRIKMAEMDPALLKKACEAKDTERQITMFDFDRLAQVDNIKERNELLKDIGKDSFTWKLSTTLRKQRAKAVRNDALKVLKDAGLIKIKDEEEYSSKYDRMYGKDVDLGEWKPGEKLIPDSKEQLYYHINDVTVKFYTKPMKVKEEPPKKTEAEKQREKKIDLAWATADRIRDTSKEMRAAFAEGLTVKPSNAMQMLRWAIIAAMSDMVDHNYNLYTELRKKFDLKGDYRWDIVDDLEKKIMEMPQSKWPCLILAMFDGIPEEKKDTQSFAVGYRKEWPEFTRNTRLEQCYKWLTEFGYKMSEEEIQMMSGTHDCFKKG